MEAVEWAAIGHQHGALDLKHLEHGLVRLLRMRLLLGVGDAAVGEPSIKVLKRLERRSWRKELLADDTDLVLDLPLLPARPRGTGGRLNQV